MKKVIRTLAIMMVLIMTLTLPCQKLFAETLEYGIECEQIVDTYDRSSGSIEKILTYDLQCLGQVSMEIRVKAAQVSDLVKIDEYLTALESINAKQRRTIRQNLRIIDGSIFPIQD